MARAKTVSSINTFLIEFRVVTGGCTRGLNLGQVSHESIQNVSRKEESQEKIQSRWGLFNSRRE